MPTTEHQVVKPEKLVATAVGVLEQELVLSRLIAREGVDQYKGAEDDTISYKVEGVLPHHSYAWRNDRSTGITFDVYKERKIAVSFGGNTYSAVKLTDEQNDFDLDSWAKLLTPQAKAVARGLEHKVLSTMTGATYNVVIGNAGQKIRSAVIEARRVLNKFHAPKGNRILLVGSEFEAAMLEDPDLVIASNVGDSLAESALRDAVIGRAGGFTIVMDESIPGDEAIAFADSAFFLATGAPSVPQSAPYGATTSFEGFALRWVRDYDSEYMQDRSVVNCYSGTRVVTDPLMYWDPTANGGNGAEVVTDAEYMVRAIKLTLDGASNYPAASSELAKATGISDAAVWTPTGAAAETDPANA
ncbi:hypothetical protein [Streptomyces sp. NBC_01198]|uniref:hypothetical protein n=1 Tax=Streptomyces sp. NBC_01198 TaxID=2903769 RepID=UPI002E157EA9|nr:hypothetical protein OG702_32055 [Streptomyces sp. NBC_01198]